MRPHEPPPQRQTLDHLGMVCAQGIGGQVVHRGRTWTPCPGAIPPKHADPYVFRHASTQQWILISFVYPDTPPRLPLLSLERPAVLDADERVPGAAARVSVAL